MRKAIMLAMLLAVLPSCTATRDTTPCNNSRLLDLREKQELSADERYVLDSLEQRCRQYEASVADTPLEPQENISGWIRGAIIVVGSLLVLYISGAFD
jgi:hypothetical protein